VAFSAIPGAGCEGSSSLVAVSSAAEGDGHETEHREDHRYPTAKPSGPRSPSKALTDRWGRSEGLANFPDLLSHRRIRQAA
jgi:hypothetical protein